MQNGKIFSESIFSEIIDEKATGDYSVEIKAGIISARREGRSVEDLLIFATKTPAGDDIWKIFLHRRSIIAKIGFQYDFTDFVEEVLDPEVNF